MEAAINGASIFVAALVGLFVGVVATIAFRVSERAQRAMPPQPAPELDDGLVRVMAVLRSAAVVLGPDDVILRASPPAYALGVVRDDQVAHEAVRDLVRATRDDGQIREQELELPRGIAGSSAVLLQMRVAPLGFGRVLLLAEDRTEAQRIEAIRRDFVVNASHELKTPVGAMSLLAETIADAADDPVAVRRFAERIEVEATRLTALVQEIIELSRVQASGALADAGTVDLADVVAEAVDRAQTVAAAKNIVVTQGSAGLDKLDRRSATPVAELPVVALREPQEPEAKGRLETPGGGPVVFGDHDLLVTAVRNLIDNAVAYSPANTRVGVSVGVRDGLAEIAVVDQGIGIDPAAQQRVFERFYRVDPARSRDTGGTGLGLSIVKHVAADHGGDVQIWSQPGKGSTFTLRIPVAGKDAS